MSIDTCKIRETLSIGDGIAVTIVSTLGGQVSLGFQVPENTPKFREEVYRRIQENALNRRTLSGEIGAEWFFSRLGITAAKGESFAH